MKQHYLKAAGAKVSAALFFTALTLPNVTSAEEIALISHDGSTHMTGTLVDYSAGTYRIDTALGALLISANLVSCEGVDCPNPAKVQEDLLAASLSATQQKPQPVLASSN